MPGAAATTAASTGPAVQEDPRRGKRTLLLALRALLLVVAAGVIGGVVGTGRTARRKPAPSPSIVDSASIIDALVVANEVQLPGSAAGGGGTTVTPTSTTTPNTTSTTSTAATAAPVPTVNNPLDAIKAMFGGGGSGGSSAARPMPAQLVTQPTADGVPAGAVITQSWKQLEGNGRSVICYPKDGKDIEAMVGPDNPCNVLVLRNGPEKEYIITRTLNVSTPKVVLGTPVLMPVMNCSRGLERMWDVKAGGNVDVRFVTLVRGFGRQAGAQREVRLTMGSIALIRVGGYFTASGCLLRERPNRASNFIEEVRRSMENPMTRNRNIGQLFLAIGGNIRLTGCRLLRLRPFGNGVFNNIVVGNDVLVVAGNGVLIGCLWYSASLFSPGIWRSGNAIAVLGGTGLLVGGAMYGATCAQTDFSWGAHLFVGAGVLVTIGWGRVSTNLNLLRVNGGQFSAGTGAFIQVGLFQARAWAVAGVFGPGQSYANAAGIYYKILSTFASFDIAASFMGVGGSMYLGAGAFKYIQVARVSMSNARTTYGCGSTIFNGGGTLSQIYIDQLSVSTSRWMAGVGSDWFLGGGWATSINHTRFGYNVVNAFTGFGGQSFVGLGAAIWIRSYSYSARVKNWNSCPYTYTVAGMGTRKTRGTSYFISKNGLTEFRYNKTDKTMTKISTGKTQKTPRPTAMPGSKHRRLPVITEKRTRRYLEADPAEAAKHSWLADAVAAVNALPYEVPNKAIVLSSTIAESERGPPSLDEFQTPDLKNGWGGYVKAWADALKEDTDGARREMREAPERRIIPGKVSANNSACFLCQVGPGATADHVGGPDACEVTDQCDGEGPLEVQAAAQAQTQQDLSLPQTAFMPYVDEDGGLQNADVTLLWHELTVYCRATDPAATDAALVDEGCLDRAYIKSLVMEYMGEDVSKMVEVAVSESKVHDAAKATVADLDEDGELAAAMAPEWNPECQGWSKYNVYVTTTFADVADAIKQIWAEMVENPYPFSDAVVANADPEAALQPCLVTVQRKTSVTYPSLNKMPAYKPSREMSLAPALTVGSATAIVPVESIVAGREYTLFVQNFPHNSQIDIVLKDGTGANTLAEDEGGRTMVAAVDAFNDEDGIEEVLWTAPHTPGRYYLQAFPTNAPALFATSSVFTIVDPEATAMDEHEEHIGQRRRLWRF